MAENISVKIDGQTVEVPPGTLIIEAAKKVGIEIPTFCYDDRLRPVGACRMCLVEVEKIPKLIASCATPVAPNMVVHTESERVVKSRQGVLQLLLINHPLDCPTCDKGGECPLQDNAYDYGPAQSEYKEDKIRFMDDDFNQKFDDKPLGPEIFLNRNRCIMCFKCVRIARDLAGEPEIGVFKRGSFAHINVLDEVEFANEYSGNTVEYCPVGALTSRSFRYKIRDWLLKKSPSVCNLCSDGCNMNIEWSNDKVHRNMARRNEQVDDGWLCDRGRYAFDIAESEERITKTHLRKGDSLQACTWDEAAALLAKHLSKIIDDNKGSEVAAIGSPVLSNEEAYAIRKFFGQIVKTSDIDFQTDLVTPVKPNLLDNIGLDGTLNDLKNEDLIILVGCDIAAEHPIASLKIRNAIAKKRAKVVFISSYNKRLGNYPVENIRIPFGTEAVALRQLLSLKNNANPELDLFSDDASKLKELANDLNKQQNVHIITGREFFTHPDRDGLLSSLIKLRNAVNAKLSILPTSANYLGVARFGLSGGDSHTFSDILAKINNGQIKTLFVFGSDPVNEYPDRKYVRETLKKLDFLVITSPFITQTASYASLVFPQALLNDYNGSFMNIEGRIQRFVTTARNPHFGIKPVWGLLDDLCDLMDVGTRCNGDAHIRQDMAKNISGLENITNIPEQGLIFPTSVKADIETDDQAIKDMPKAGDDGSYLLTWALTVHHSGWFTEKSENLMRVSAKQIAVIHPDDASRDGIEDNQTVRIGNDETALNLPIKVSADVNKGEVLILNSFEDNPVNRILSKDVKFTFVTIKKT